MSTPLDPERWRDRSALLAGVAVTFLVFAFTLRNGFVATWDDGIYVLNNDSIRELSLATVGWAFSAVHHLWAPLTWLSFALDHAVWGLDPFGFHLTNTLCHALDAGLVFWLALEVLGSSSPGLPRGTRRAAALLAAVAWSLHPLRVESVAWVSERKDVLSALLGIAAVLVYLRYAKSAARTFWRSGSYAVALGLYVLSLFAKPSFVTLPLVLLILDWYPLRRFGSEGARTVLLEKAAFIVPAGVVTAITSAAFEGAGVPLVDLDVGSRILVALRATWDYARLSAWPSGLSPFYLHPLRVSVLDPAYLLPAAGVVALTATAVVQARRRPALAAAWLGFLALVAPGLAATNVSDTAMADRFTYLPAIPLSLLAAGTIASFVSRRSSRTLLSVGGGGAIVLIATLIGLTVRQISFWRDDVTLWTRAIDVRPHFSGRMYFMRAGAHEMRGDWRNALLDMDEAIAIASAKRYARMQDLLSRRARILAQSGNLEGAAADLGRAIEAERSPPGRSGLHRERAEVYRALGREDLAAEDLRLAGLPER
jgi:tetratricopeptide (TPR) repeat protein